MPGQNVFWERREWNHEQPRESADCLKSQDPGRVPIDFGSFPGATSMNVWAYKNLLEYLGSSGTSGSVP